MYLHQAQPAFCAGSRPFRQVALTRSYASGCAAGDEQVAALQEWLAGYTSGK